ncbi:MAG: PKD domain-containing protein, partial [Bacteroidetes bacterium]|nr:PKD domain-containing protein [Bacteroidota bacterium]
MEKIYNRFGVLLALFLLQFNYSILAQCNAIITSNSQAKGCSPFTLQLTDASTGVVTNRVWNFGDGSATSGTQNPIHTFTTSASGNDTTYTVSLKVYCVGNDSSVTTFSVLVYSPPKVAFTSNKFSFCSFSDTVCFTNTSEFSLLHSYLWNFGDNTSSTQYSPCKVFTNTGSYNIQLIVTDSNSCQQTLLKTNYVTAKKAPNPDFTVTPQLGCNPLPTSITNTTNTLQDTIASWSWDFGDGTTSSQQNPAAHTYTLAPDTATITLFATNNLGCKNSTTKVVVIKPTPVALFTMPIEICLGSSANIVFTGSASTGATYTWSFNGGTVNSGTGAGPYSVSWNSQGVKTVTLTVNDNGCSATYVKSINVNNLPPVTLTTNTGSDTICNGVPIVFTASPSNYAAYHFFLNSGSVQNTNSNTYTNASLNNNDQISVQVTDIKGSVSTLSA